MKRSGGVEAETPRLAKANTLRYGFLSTRYRCQYATVALMAEEWSYIPDA